MGERSPRTTLLLLNCQYSFYKKAFLYVNIRNCYCTNRDHAPPPPLGLDSGRDMILGPRMDANCIKGVKSVTRESIFGTRRGAMFNFGMYMAVKKVENYSLKHFD